MTQTMTPPQQRAAMSGQPVYEISDADKARLIDCLERFVACIESRSVLPSMISSDVQGVRCSHARADLICNGYSSRECKDERQLASMLLWSAAQFVFFKEHTMSYLKLCDVPSTQEMKEVVDMLQAYTAGGGQIGYPQ